MRGPLLSLCALALVAGCGVEASLDPPEADAGSSGSSSGAAASSSSGAGKSSSSGNANSSGSSSGTASGSASGSTPGSGGEDGGDTTVGAEDAGFGSGSVNDSGAAPTTCAQADAVYGCCVGNVLYFCPASGPTLVEKTCAAGLVCGWEATLGYYACVPPPSVADPSGTYPLACQ